MAQCGKCKASGANLAEEVVHTAGGAGREKMVYCRLCGYIEVMECALDNSMKRSLATPKESVGKGVVVCGDSVAPAEPDSRSARVGENNQDCGGARQSAESGPVGSGIPARYRKPCSLEGCEGFYFEGKSSLELCAVHAKIMRRWLGGQQTTPGPYVKDTEGDWVVNPQRAIYEEEKRARLQGKKSSDLASVA